MLAVLMVVGILPVTANAAATLTITQPDNWEWIEKSDPPVLKWNKISGAAGYTVTVKDDETGEYYTQNEWTTKTSYDLLDLFDSTLGYNDFPRLKIWVGAMKSTDISQGLIHVDAQDSIIVVVSDPPVVNMKSCSSITSDSVTLEMKITKDCGSPIVDCGFQVILNGSAKEYSFLDYDPDEATTKGTKTMRVTGLKPGTTYEVRAYAENGMGKTVSSKKTFKTEKETTLQVSEDYVSWGYGAGNEANITVTGSGSYTIEDTEYWFTTSDPIEGFDYEWLEVTKSGNTINLRPKRANYYREEREAVVKVTSGSESKEITVIQAACGESAPTLTLKRGNTVLTDGMDLGAFTVGQSVMEASIVSSNVRRVSAQLRSVSGTMALDTSTDLNKISLDISDLGVGDYKVTVYASNSDTANDYWSQSPFSDGSMEFYFSLVEKGSGSGSGGNGSEITAARQAVIDRAYEWYNKTWTLEQNLELWHSPSSTGKVIPAGTVVRGIPYTQFNCLYSIDGTLPGSSNYFNLGEKKYDMVVDTYCPGVQANRTAPKYGAECVQLVYDAWYHGNSAIGKRGVDWSLIIGDNKKRGLVEEITWDKVQPGDALAIGSHIRLIVAVNNSNTPNDYTDDKYEVIEQTTSYLGSNNNIGTTKTTYTYSSLVAKNYVPYRYIKLDSEGTISITYTVTYDANGGSGAPAAQTKTEGKALTLSSKVPTWSGYTFLGWATSKTATAAQYQPGGTYTKDADVTLYAVWKAEEHKHSFDETVTDPTCTEKGYTTYTCSECGYSYVGNYVDATGHSLGDWYVVNDPTCTEKGEEQRYCYNCYYVETREVKALGHNYSSEKIAPTCTEKGYTLHTCLNCGDSYKDNYVDKTAHVFSDWYFTVSPTCTEKGEEQRYCYNCYYVETREVEATGHSFGEWEVVKEPTGTEKGEERRECRTCGYYETREIPALGTYTVTYDANGGSGAPSAQTKTKGKALTLSNVKPTRNGYAFQGWAISKTASKAEYQPGGSYTKDANVTLYAVWKKNEPQKTANIVVGEVSGKAGDIVEVPVYINNNPGFASIDLKLEFDSNVLELTDVQFALFPSSNMASLVSGKISGGDSKNITGDGELFTAVFKIKETAKEGTSNVNIIIYECCDINDNFIDIAVSSGKVEICSYVLGDANGDGKVTSRDVTRILQYLVDELGDKTIDEKAADYNCDGKITSRDITAILKYLVD